MLLVIVVTPPWILFVKPLILKREHEEAMKEKESNGGDFELTAVQSRGSKKKIKQQSPGELQMTSLNRDEEESQILSGHSSYDPYEPKQNHQTTADSSSIGSG